MQSSYEDRLADLQISYDELNGALVNAQDRFKAAADQLQTRQNAISGFLARKTQIESSVGAGKAAGAAPADSMTASDSLSGGTMAGGTMAPAAMAHANMEGPDDAVPEAGGTLSVLPGPAAPQPRTGKPQPGLLKTGTLKTETLKVGMLEGWWQRAGKLASALFAPAQASPSQLAAAYAQHPGLRALSEQTQRLNRMGDGETLLMAQTEAALKDDVGGLRALVRRAGLNLDTMTRQQAVGGPDIPLEQAHVDGVPEGPFGLAYLRAAAVLDQLNGLSKEVGHIPLSAPVDSVTFDRSSGFGSRIDPFTGQYAFHSGIDFAGPWGSRVAATAAGKVVFAGYNGGYGNMVEIDHGFGLHTRYGHLSAITVKVGAQVDKGATLGRVGSTGRSTGPHVHYEVWFDDKVRNPSNFIEAGRHVL
jgi:murein DD-endopeptidase MepM/ murein hydrolase activator NlpD